MPTAPSSTRDAALTAPPQRPGAVRRSVRAAADVAPLLALRVAGLRGRRTRARVLLVVALGLTAAVAIVPALHPEAGQPGRAGELLLLLPSVYLSVLGIAIASAAAAGGGRELLARDEAVAFPVSPTTDHLGSLLLAPLNIAWLLQTWAVLGATAYAWGLGDGPADLLLVQLPVLAWVLVATALAQAVAWTVEWVRRTRHGRTAIRLLVLVLAAGSATLVVTGATSRLLDQSPTVRLVLLSGQGRGGDVASYVGGLAILLALFVAAVVVGALPVHRLARLPAREESALETSHHAARPHPRSDLRALLRLDRASVWRSVPLRRGIAVLALMPGAVALAGGLGWDSLLIMPGLVASGGALLFAVNAWCLDGRGAFWRETLPCAPSTALLARTVVLVEVLVVATVVTLVLSAIRAGAPTPEQAAAMGAVSVVVIVMVTARSLQWSVERPYAADLRSARATPAPPAAMFGYSVRLATATTATSLVFTALLTLEDWRIPLLTAVPFLLFAARRLVRVVRRWDDPPARARVIATVAG